MKKLFLLSIFCLVFSFGCKLDFSNTADDEWIVINNTANYNSENPLKVFFNSEEKTITEKSTTIKAPEDAEITIAENYHVDFETGYSYSSSPAKRKLTITDQTKYIFRIVNNSNKTLYIEYKENVTEVDVAKDVTFTVYKTKPKYKFYYLNGAEKIFYTGYSEQVTSQNNYTIVIN